MSSKRTARTAPRWRKRLDLSRPWWMARFGLSESDARFRGSEGKRNGLNRLRSPLPPRWLPTDPTGRRRGSWRTASINSPSNARGVHSEAPDGLPRAFLSPSVLVQTAGRQCRAGPAPIAVRKTFPHAMEAADRSEWKGCSRCRLATRPGEMPPAGDGTRNPTAFVQN